MMLFTLIFMLDLKRLFSVSRVFSPGAISNYFLWRGTTLFFTSET
jgi:hypothetical protein